MTKQPLVSVIMPVYNSGRYVWQAIISIMDQTYKNFEFIIIDDHSSDDSWFTIKQFASKDKRIKAYRNEKNMGIVYTRNKGFKLMDKKAKYIAIFDADDVSYPNRLEEQVYYFENRNKDLNLGALGSYIDLIDEECNNIGHREYEYNPYRIRKNILMKSPVAQPSVMIRRDVIDDVGGYRVDSGFDRAEDFNLWVRINDKYDIANIPIPLIKYRISSTQGKTTHLKETIRSTINTQWTWLFKPGYFDARVLFVNIALRFMLLLPSKLILYVFKKMEYDKK